MKLNDKEIVFHETFIIGKNETLDFTFSPTHPDPSLLATYNKESIGVKLKVSGSEDSINAEWGKENGLQFVTITIPEIQNRIGPAILEKPIRIGQIQGKNLGIKVAFSSAGDTYLVTLQIMFGGSYE